MTERPFWQRFLYVIFPAVKRVLNYITILVLRIFRSVVKTISDQI